MLSCYTKTSVGVLKVSCRTFCTLASLYRMECFASNCQVGIWGRTYFKEAHIQLLWVSLMRYVIPIKSKQYLVVVGNAQQRRRLDLIIMVNSCLVNFHVVTMINRFGNSGKGYGIGSVCFLILTLHSCR